MVQTNHAKQLSSAELAEELLRQRDVLHHHRYRVEEPRRRVADYEARYGISSDHVHEAIDRHELTETDDVCDWIIDYELLLRTQAPGERSSSLD